MPHPHHRERNLKHRYGLTTADYQAMYDAQGGQCAICKASQETLQIDHCHVSKEPRKLLCRHCNIGLGHFFDNPRRLRAAIRYLKAHEPMDIV